MPRLQTLCSPDSLLPSRLTNAEDVDGSPMFPSYGRVPPHGMFGMRGRVFCTREVRF